MKSDPLKKQSKPKRARPPQEKKRLSYDKDRRNVYGESTGASRKGIRRRKAWQSRVRRASAKQVIQKLNVDESRAEKDLGKISQDLRWKKSPDVSLGEVVKRKLARRKSPRKTGIKG